MFAADKFISQENSGKRIAVKRHSISGGCGFDLSNLNEEDGFEPKGPTPSKQIHLAEKEAKEEMKEKIEVETKIEDEMSNIGNGHGKYIGFGTAAIHAGNHPERWDMNQVCFGVENWPNHSFPLSRLLRPFPSRPPIANQNLANQLGMTIPGPGIQRGMYSKRTLLHWKRGNIVCPFSQFTI
jgi:hypothetical protein